VLWVATFGMVVPFHARAAQPFPAIRCDSIATDIAHAEATLREKDLLRWFEAAARTCPLDARIPTAVAGWWERQEYGTGDFSKARQYYRRALALDPNNEQANFGRGRIAFGAASWDSAICFLGKYAQLIAGRTEAAGIAGRVDRLIIKAGWLRELKPGAVSKRCLLRESSELPGVPDVLGDVAIGMGQGAMQASGSSAYGIAGVLLGNAISAMGTPAARERRNWIDVESSLKEHHRGWARKHALNGLPVAVEAYGLESPAVAARLHVICTCGDAGLQPLKDRTHAAFCRGAAMFESDAGFNYREYANVVEAPGECAFLASLAACQAGDDCRLRSMDSLLTRLERSGSVGVTGACALGYGLQLVADTTAPLRGRRIHECMDRVRSGLSSRQEFPGVSNVDSTVVVFVLSSVLTSPLRPSELAEMETSLSGLELDFGELEDVGRCARLGRELLEARLAEKPIDYAAVLARRHIPEKAPWTSFRVMHELTRLSGPP
jgi:tetratricopeptide (TPR) repeat protein